VVKRETVTGVYTFNACPKIGPGSPTSDVVFVCFIDIAGIVDHHHVNSLFTTYILLVAVDFSFVLPI
jgi:hypothetical protein